jgi:2-polyprenyl-3-methyl-5-hydroxy-6-metoxy-1,4-benzoquinol methylase
MAKKAEKKYFKSIGQNGLEFTLQKPFSDLPNLGALLSNIAAVITVICNKFRYENVRVVDIGCGTGWTSYFLARAGYRTVGVDLSKDAIEAAQTKFAEELSNLEYINGDFEKLPSKLSDFEVALFIDSLHHADNPLAALQSAYRIIREDGICIICEPGRGHTKAADAIMARQAYGVNENDIVPKEIKKMAKKVGFKKVKILPYPPDIHKIVYKEFNPKTLKSKLLNNTAARTLALFYGQVYKKNQEGLIVLYR